MQPFFKKGAGVKPIGEGELPALSPAGQVPKNFGITCYTILIYGSSPFILEAYFNMGWGLEYGKLSKIH